MADKDYDLLEELARGRLDGSLLRAKGRILLEEALTEVHHLLVSPDTPKSVKVELLKFLLELGDMKARPSQQQAPASPFTINISIPGQAQPLVIDATPVGSDDDLPPMPEHLKIGTFAVDV